MDIGTHCGKETKRENTQQTCFAASTVTDDDQFPRATVDVRKVGPQKEGLCKKRRLWSGTVVPHSASWAAYLRMTFWALRSFAMAGK